MDELFQVHSALMCFFLDAFSLVLGHTRTRQRGGTVRGARDSEQLPAQTHDGPQPPMRTQSTSACTGRTEVKTAKQRTGTWQ